MRILLVSDFFPPVRGGLETYVDNLAAELADRGHDVHVASLTEHPSPQRDGVQTHPVSTTSAKLVTHQDGDRPFHPPWPDPRARLVLAQLLRRIKPDVVHAHSWLGVSLPKSVPAPLILTAHDYALACQRRTMLRWGNEPCPGPSVRACLPCGAQEYGLIKSAVIGGGTAIGRRLLHPQRVLTLSEFVRSRLLPYVSAPVDVIPGFVPRHLEAGHEPPVEGRYVMYAGDAGAHKGLETLLEVWQRWQPADLRLLVATTRPADLPTIPGVVARTLSPAGVMAGWRNALAAVVPSKWDEPFGMVAIEALTVGTPVIAHRVGALPEIVRDQDNGLLVDAGDPANLMAALRHISEHASLREQLSSGARRSESAYSPDAVVPRIEAVYQEAVEQARRVPRPRSLITS